MAFDIGQRVTSKFYGTGTVTSEFFKDPEDDAKHPITYQRVKFDKYGIETSVQVAKLEPYEDPKPKAIKVKKDASQEAYEAATAEGLTHFLTVPFDRDEPNVSCSEFQWLGIELASRGCKITVYATEKNFAKVAQELADIKQIDLDKACDLVSIRKRKTSGGSKWNVDFANFPALNTTVRDAIGVNFNHQKFSGQYPNIRQVRIGSTKFVQELIRTGFDVERIYEEDGETRKANVAEDKKVS
jgi:hypothetical protein